MIHILPTGPLKAVQTYLAYQITLTGALTAIKCFIAVMLQKQRCFFYFIECQAIGKTFYRLINK